MSDPAGADLLAHEIRGAGRCLIVLHGGGLDRQHMIEALEPAVPRSSGWRRIYLDLPGCGESRGYDDVGSQDDVLDCVARTVLALANEERFAVLGESRGSYVAQGLAHRMPERLAGVALIVPTGASGMPDTEPPSPVTLDPTPELAVGLDASERGRFERLVVQSPEILDRIRRTKLPAAARHDRHLEARVQGAFAFSFAAEMAEARVDIPSLLIAGRQDSISHYADAVRLAERFSRSTLAVLDCAGHSLSWERPALFAALVHDWLARMA